MSSSRGSSEHPGDGLDLGFSETSSDVYRNAARQGMESDSEPASQRNDRYNREDLNRSTRELRVMRGSYYFTHASKMGLLRQLPAIYSTDFGNSTTSAALDTAGANITT